MRRSIILFLAALLCFVAGSYATYHDSHLWLNQRELDQQGLLAEGQIESRMTSSVGSRHAKNHSMKVRFTPAGGASLDVHLPVSDTYFDAHSSAGPTKVTVRYLRDHPQTAEIEGERRFPIGIVIGPVFVVIGLFLVLARFLRLARGLG